MISYYSAQYRIDSISGPSPQTKEPGEHFAEMEEVNSAARRNRLRSAWTAITSAPLVVRRQVAELVPAWIGAALTARANSRELVRNIKRMQDLGPHLLKDIGMQQVAADVYEVIETAEPLAEAGPAAPGAIRIETAPAARPVYVVPQRTRRISTRGGHKPNRSALSAHSSGVRSPENNPQLQNGSPLVPRSSSVASESGL